jgi:hypothetical protein
MYDDCIGEQVTCARLSKDGHCNVVSVVRVRVMTIVIQRHLMQIKKEKQLAQHIKLNTQIKKIRQMKSMYRDVKKPL